MPATEESIARIVNAPTWDQRIAQIRLIPQRHGIGEHQGIYAAVAQQIYVPQLAPNFAYIHWADFYDRGYFETAYA